jgi:phosphate transport system permease protein
VIGSAQHGITLNLFSLGDTLASRIANQYQGALTHLTTASIVYLAFILLVFTLIVNVSAQVIVKRFELKQAGG